MNQKAIFIAFDQAQEEAVLAVLSRSNARGYTQFGTTQGRGSVTGDPHLGSHAWPTMNSAILTIVNEEQVDPILRRLKEADEDNPMLGLRAFVWSVEQSV